jgi:hypothetical protein
MTLAELLFMKKETDAAIYHFQQLLVRIKYPCTLSTEISWDPVAVRRATFSQRAAAA